MYDRQDSCFFFSLQANINTWALPRSYLPATTKLNSKTVMSIVIFLIFSIIINSPLTHYLIYFHINRIRYFKMSILFIFRLWAIAEARDMGATTNHGATITASPKHLVTLIIAASPPCSRESCDAATTSMQKPRSLQQMMICLAASFISPRFIYVCHRSIKKNIRCAGNRSPMLTLWFLKCNHLFDKIIYSIKNIIP